MTVQLSGVGRPMTQGSRKYIQKMTISRGMPRMAFTTASVAYRITRFRETQRSPMMRPPKKERIQETTARYMVRARPPIGPLG